MSADHVGQCEYCRFCAKYYIEAFTCFWGLLGQPQRRREWWECHRYAPSEDGWPDVDEDGWCGEFVAYDSDEGSEPAAQ